MTSRKGQGEGLIPQNLPKATAALPSLRKKFLSTP